MVAMVIMKGSWEDDLMIPWISLVGDDDNHDDDDGGVRCFTGSSDCPS